MKLTEEEKILIINIVKDRMVRNRDVYSRIENKALIESLKTENKKLDKINDKLT